MGRQYRIGELAREMGVSKRTIDYYTQLGLLQPERSESNYRYYTDRSVERLKLIQQLKREKLTLEEIRDRLALLERLDPSHVPEKIHELHHQICHLENNLLEVKELLGRLDSSQRRILANQLSVPCFSLYHTLAMILGL
ncbi:MerR family transcriptional regulator [Brevibacillus humidisoli]|uniref:MerR family transcriptional regulator n=1 Tax=Brevibacillus humidisoli TaxID=2895522 RepID=UPI001E552130|nr:MerR family transcriptional regulator [Brevibacillus humidisoli]UFJ39537.1 MerR family transcriptional regulator [Brevibacillus humidisoli]